MQIWMNFIKKELHQNYQTEEIQRNQFNLCIAGDEIAILPTGSVLPNTDEKLLSETNALVCCAGAKMEKRTVHFWVHKLWDWWEYLPTSGCAGGAAPNISANGFPSCNKSSDAFAFGGWADAAVGPNKSTILPDVVGDDKNGLFTAADAPPVGDVNFVCWKNKDE